MCGIFAAFSYEEPFYDRGRFSESLKLIANRGPDAEGELFLKDGEVSDAEFNVYLGHKRLAILDLDSRSNQPMVKDHVKLIFNGEIYNYIELREKLIKLGHSFVSKSDTEVIIHLYLEYGDTFFSQLNGMWSIILYDTKKNEVLVSRDRFGIKPLYTHVNNGKIYFASEIKQLKLFIKSLTPNVVQLDRFVQDGSCDISNETFFNEIHKFPACTSEVFQLNSGKSSQRRFWNFSKQNDSSLSMSDSVEQFRELFVDSLKLRLRCDVPFGSLLSGGLDSSAISIIIQDYILPEIETFSVVSDSEKYSEHKFIDLLVAENKIKNKSFNFQVDEAIDNVDSVLDVQDEPFGSFSIVAQNGLFKKIKEETDIKVLLSGQGADEVLMGYLKYYFMNIKQEIRKGNLHKVFSYIAGALYQGTILNQFSMKQAKRYLPGSSKLFQPYYTGVSGSSNLAYSTMQERQILDVENYSIPALTRYEDRNSMNHSLEVRLPFLDYRLVDFLTNMSVDKKLKNGWSKYILRESITELPKEIRWRKDKMGFTTPEADWWKGDFGLNFQQTFNQSRLDELGIIDKHKFTSAFSSYRNGNGHLSEGDIFRVYIAEKWLNKF